MKEIELVQELLYRAEFFLKSYKKLKDIYDSNIPNDENDAIKYKSSKLAISMKINANLYYFESVSCIASLLTKENVDPSKNEVSFALLKRHLDNITVDKYVNDLQNIYDKYYNSGLRILRNKIVDHKDYNTSGNPVTSFFKFINPILIDRCQEIINELKSLLTNYFPQYLYNDYFSGYYDPAMKEYVRLLRKEIDKQ